jgi:hypothetical protein
MVAVTSRGWSWLPVLTVRRLRERVARLARSSERLVLLLPLLEARIVKSPAGSAALAGGRRHASAASMGNGEELAPDVALRVAKRTEGALVDIPELPLCASVARPDLLWPKCESGAVQESRVLLRWLVREVGWLARVSRPGAVPVRDAGCP